MIFFLIFSRLRITWIMRAKCRTWTLWNDIWNGESNHHHYSLKCNIIHFGAWWNRWEYILLLAYHWICFLTAHAVCIANSNGFSPYAAIAHTMYVVNNSYAYWLNVRLSAYQKYLFIFALDFGMTTTVIHFAWQKSSLLPIPNEMLWQIFAFERFEIISAQCAYHFIIL